MDARIALARGMVRLRKDRGWTQALLAEKADISLQFVAALEQAAKAPSFETVDRLCAAFDVAPSELFAAGEESPSKKPANKELVRVAAAIPAEVEKDAVELLHVLSRVASRAGKTTTRSRRK